MIDAAEQAWPARSAALRIEDVDHIEAARFLEHVFGGPEPRGWKKLIDELRNDGNGPLAKALASPLALTLLRDTYIPGDDVGDLLDVARRNGREAAEDYLLNRVVMAAYRRVPVSQPSSPSTPSEQAKRTLTAIAKELDGGRDEKG